MLIHHLFHIVIKFLLFKRIEKQLDKDLEETNGGDEKLKTSSSSTSINSRQKNLTNELKNIPKQIKLDDLTDEERTLKAEQEKCKGNEAFNARSFDEALVYYTRSIQYLPNAASFNNRALTCN